MKNDLPYYEKEGKRYDRITHILDYFQNPELVKWKLRVGAKEAKRVSTIALKIGTNVDEAIKNPGVKLKSDEAKNCYEAFKQWQKDYGYPTLTNGETVFDVDFMVAGTPDLIDLDKATLIDIKCSSEIRDSYWLQTEFYARRSPYLIVDKAILRLDKNLGIYEYKKMRLDEDHWDVCVGAIKLFRYYNKPVNDGKEEV